MSEESERLRAQLEVARQTIARMEQQAETNRAFYARTLQEAHRNPHRGGGPTLWHVLSALGGLGVGALLTLGLLAAREPPPAFVPLPPPRPVAAPGPPILKPPAPAPPPTADTATAGQGGGGGAPAIAAPARPVRPTGTGPKAPDDSGWLKVTSDLTATVFVDGRRVGNTPAQVPLKPGQHLLSVDCSTDGGLPVRSEVEVPPFAEVEVHHQCAL